ncbi:sensor histidine kinase [Methylophilus sp. TWE2]|uniref:sensor histidine kinase n=1 Tax=Methylophilus sp. TWE2 TaxID=1662285 RepID=UPI00067137AB|nr:ATP-binding protein [Methylophilus sp. TWE2]AKR43908.1 hypothetical protein ACJ67_11150 [Methylophilus sp. TWE2]
MMSFAKNWSQLILICCISWFYCVAQAGPSTHQVVKNIMLGISQQSFETADDDLLPNNMPTVWRSVELPYYQPRQIGQVDSRSEVTSYWFKINLTSQIPKHGNRYAVYLPRWQTIGKIKVYADQQLVFSSNSGPVWNGYNYPLWLTFQAHQIPKTLLIRVDASQQAGMGLSKIYFGDEQDLYLKYLTRTWVQTHFPEIASSALLLTGLFAFTIWLRRRDEFIYLLFFCVSIFSYIRCMQYFVGVNPLIIPENWFSWLVVNASGWTIIFTYATCSHLYQISFKRLQFGLICIMALVSIFTLPTLNLAHDFGQVWSMASLIIFGVLVFYAGMMVVASWKSRSKEGAVLSSVFVFNIPLGIHDLMLQNYQISLENVYLLPYTAIGSMFVLILIVRARYLKAMKDIQLSNIHLETKLAAQEKELNESYEIKKRQERQQLLSHERERLMKDMHDGFGSTLSTTLILLKNGQITPQQVEGYLEECIIDLKLVIDSIEPAENTLDSALANFAYRIKQKLAYTNIELDQQFDSIPVIEWITPTYTLDILRIIQEVFANIFKHASSNRITWQVSSQYPNLVINIQDNGRGFDHTQVSKSRGLKNIQVRSRSLGAHVEWLSGADGTTFTMTIPMYRDGE